MSIKTALFLISLAFILTLLCANQKSTALALTYNVFAFVPEHLTYFQTEDGILISTNINSGFFLDCNQKNIRLEKPSKDSYLLPCASNFLLITNY